MDDYSVASLSESKNEWCARLVNVLTTPIIEGLKSIFEESWNLCITNDEEEKYLMTFQTFLSRIPKWNAEIIKTEKGRIEESSNCHYLEDLISCVHVVQLKALTCVRVGQKQKKIDIDIPNADSFIHQIYIIVARKLYTNVYLFEKYIAPLDIQKNNRELEIIIRESIMQSIRDTMPVEAILRAYMDETEEQNVDIEEEVFVSPIQTDTANNVISTPVNIEDKNEEDTVADKNKDNVTLVVKSDATAPVVASASTASVSSSVATAPVPAPAVAAAPVPAPAVAAAPAPAAVPSAVPSAAPPAAHSAAPLAVPSPWSVPAPPPPPSSLGSSTAASLAFSDVDRAVDTHGHESTIEAPKTQERLEQIAVESNERRKKEEAEDDEQLNIGDEIKLELGDINDLNGPVNINPPVLNDVEVLTA